MDIKTIFRLLFFYLILDNLKYTNESNLMKINIILWSIILIYDNPLLLHYIHLIGLFQVVTGWVWMNELEQTIYRKLLFILWILFIIRKDCLVHEVIVEKGANYTSGFTNNQVIFGTPMLILLSKYNKKVLV